MKPLAAMAPLRVYVYSANSTAVRLAPCSNSRLDKDLFEEKLPALLRRSDSLLQHVDNPADAHVLYHPACLVDFYFRVRSAKDGVRRLLALESAVVHDIVALGYTHKLHFVNALRCRTINANYDFKTHITAAMPRLWRSLKVKRFCEETADEVDERNSIHLPYCPPHRAAAESLPSHRFVRVAYIGSSLFQRKKILYALHRQNFTRRLVILNPFRRARPHTLWCDIRHPLHDDGESRKVTRKNPNCSHMRDILQQSTYTLCPVGDTPDSPRVFSAIARGSIPLIEDATARVLPRILNWTMLTSVVRFALDGSMILPSPAEEHVLQANIERYRRAIDCEPQNLLLRAYVAHSLRQLIDFSSSRSCRSCVTRRCIARSCHLKGETH